MLAVQRRECRIFLCPFQPIFFYFFFFLWGVVILNHPDSSLGHVLWRGKILTEPLVSGVSFGYLAAPSSFAVESVVHLKKKHFFQRKNKIYAKLQMMSDKQVTAGKKHPGTFRLPFPQHLKAFLVLDMSHWKSPLSSDALPLGLFFHTSFG